MHERAQRSDGGHDRRHRSRRQLAERGVRVRRGDYGDPGSLAAAFEGASRVLIVSVDSVGETLQDEALYLTGAEAVDAAGIAAIASELSGRPIRRVIVPDDEHRAALVARGVPEQGAEMLVGMFAASRQGQFTRVDPTLARLVGRPPTTLRDVLKEAIPQSG